MAGFTDKYNNNQGSIELPFVHVLTEEQRNLLEKNINIVKYRKKDVIFRQDTRTSHLMFVHSGLVKIYKIGKGDRTMILNVAGNKDFIGLMSLFSDKIHQYSAAALTDTVICDIDFIVFKSVLLENGKYSLNFLNQLSLDGLFIFDRLMTQSHKQLPGRVADVILYFSEQVFGKDKFSFPFSRKELADFSGTTKESFIRTLTEFKNDKIIDIEGSSITINSMDIIRTLSNLG